jgi:hypothetical protein
LRDSIAIAQIDKNQSTVIAATMNPTVELDGFFDIGGAERATRAFGEFTH